ncbi:GH32 C-terminal domain-containing protein [Maribacter sp. ACAM166]|uniref:GH32 C-terminal domain-containing protein n=1 Tax=Maribacter sp. ACAM166 TaxID=2508996 RepID=UPI0010FE55FA|nr:GH32 C-terminal domain-containing protein [Maribacter sp. ACAM166]TLP82749.1 hypothetical protein ES765_00855 [Maribacter sp. ACAM166]
MIVPRKLTLREIDDEVFLVNYLVDKFNEILVKAYVNAEIKLKENQKKIITFKYGNQSEIKFTVKKPEIQMYFSNEVGVSLAILIDSEIQMVTFSRVISGKTGFSEKFALSLQKMDISHLPKGTIEVKILLDYSSIELLVNEGQ